MVSGDDFMLPIPLHIKLIEGRMEAIIWTEES